MFSCFGLTAQVCTMPRALLSSFLLSRLVGSHLRDPHDKQIRRNTMVPPGHLYMPEGVGGGPLASKHVNLGHLCMPRKGLAPAIPSPLQLLQARAFKSFCSRTYFLYSYANTCKLSTLLGNLTRINVCIYVHRIPYIHCILNINYIHHMH